MAPPEPIIPNISQYPISCQHICEIHCYHWSPWVTVGSPTQAIDPPCRSLYLLVVDIHFRVNIYLSIYYLQWCHFTAAGRPISWPGSLLFSLGSAWLTSHSCEISRHVAATRRSAGNTHSPLNSTAQCAYVLVTSCAICFFLQFHALD